MSQNNAGVGPVQREQACGTGRPYAGRKVPGNGGRAPAEGWITVRARGVWSQAEDFEGREDDGWRDRGGPPGDHAARPYHRYHEHQDRRPPVIAVDHRLRQRPESAELFIFMKNNDDGNEN